MRMNFDSANFGKCLAETHRQTVFIRVLIWYHVGDVAKKVEYEIIVSGPRPPGQIPGGGEAEDAARIAICHFVDSSGSNHTTHRWSCTERTGRWPGVLELVGRD